MTTFSLSCRDLKIENLLLDEQDKIKLIGNIDCVWDYFPCLNSHI